MKKDIWKECKGCSLSANTLFRKRLYCTIDSTPKFKPKFKFEGCDYECPCQKCLVKMNCIQSCVEFYRYRETAKVYVKYGKEKNGNTM